MSAVPKHKMCWQCEGNVDFTQDHCPYCGVYLSTERNFSDSNDERPFAPPYKLPTIQENENGDNINVEAATSGVIDYIKPLLFLVLGSTLSIFSLMLFLFSQNGVLTLQWNAEVWYLYLAVSLPLLWLGLRALKSTDD